MDEFEEYLSNRQAGKVQDTPVQAAMHDYNTQLGSGSSDEFSQYLGERNGLTPERKAKLAAKHIKNQEEIKRLKAEPDDGYLTAGVRSVSAGLSDIADSATLGAYRKVRNKVLQHVSPETLNTVTQAENEYHQPISGNPLMRAAQMGTNALNSLAGLSTGVGGFLGKAAMAAAKGGGVIAQGIGGAVSGGLTAGGQAAIAGERPVDALKQAGVGALAGGAIGGALGGVGKAMAGAPARAAESEMAGLTEGVGQRTKITKFLPKKEIITSELSREPVLRKAIRDAPVDALPAVQKKLQQVDESDLEPFYHGMARVGHDMVPSDLPINNLKAVRSGFDRYMEKNQIAVIDELINDLQNDAAANQGRIPVQAIREAATAAQKQGFANIPQLGPVQLSKEVKQGIGGALRESIADHLETLPSTAGAGKALSQAFRNANQRVSAWYGIQDLMEEKVKRIKTDSPTLMSVAKGVKGFVNNPLASMLPLAGPFGEAIDQGAIAPMMSSMSQPAQAARGIGRGVQQLAPVMAGPAYGQMQRAMEEKKRLQQESAANLYQENP